MTTEDALRFTSTVAQAVPFVERARGWEAVANRVYGSDPWSGSLSLEPWARARERWNRGLRRLERTARVIAVTDVRECYASIRPTVVRDQLASLGTPPGIASEVVRWLELLGDAGVVGLPIGPEASVVLADAVLLAGDIALRTSGIAHLRWVDDVVIASPDARSAVRALDRLRRAWSALGLEIHDAKTQMLDRDGFGAIRGRSRSPTGAASLR